MIRHKFNAIRTELDGIKFDSKRESEYYKELVERVNKGEVVFFLRQCPFHLPGNIKYIVDFVEFLNTGDVIFI